MNKHFYPLLLCLALHSCQHSSQALAPSLPAPNVILRGKPPSVVEQFYADNPVLSRATDSVYELMELNERAAQLIMPGTSEYKGIGIPFQEAKKLFSQKKIGSLLFLKGRSREFGREIMELDSPDSDPVLIENLYACDCEPTLLHRKFTDLDSLRATYELADTALMKEATSKTADLMRGLGIHLNFAPVVDLGVNPILERRGFSKNPDSVRRLSAEYISQLQQENIGATVKHFPGHGLVTGDSHKNQVFIDGPLRELPTFREVIAKARPLAVMVGHITIKNNMDYNTAGLPASLSRRIVTGLLKNELGFRGIVVTDAMNMSAVKIFPEADWKALEAGADLVVMPTQVEILHERIKMELKREGALKEQLENSIKKIIRYKLCLRSR